MHSLPRKIVGAAARDPARPQRMDGLPHQIALRGIQDRNRVEHPCSFETASYKIIQPSGVCVKLHAARSVLMQFAGKVGP